MDHEYTISGRIFPEPEQVKTTSEFQKFASKISWIEQDFESTGLKVDLTPCSAIVSMKSENIENPLLEQACVNLSLILDCTVMLCKHHEVYGVANVFNGGSDYELLFTISQADYEKIKDSQEVHIIGHITEEGSPCVMVTPQNTTITLLAPGWEGNE